MADFTVKVNAGAWYAWTDPASPTLPSRLNPAPEHVPTTQFVTEDEFDIVAVLGGVEAPMDTALGGRLFSFAWVEWSGDALPATQLIFGQSSRVTVQVLTAGHYTARFSRPTADLETSPCVLVHFDKTVL